VHGQKTKAMNKIFTQCDNISLSIDLMPHDQSDHATSRGPSSDDLKHNHETHYNDSNKVMLQSTKTRFNQLTDR